MPSMPKPQYVRGAYYTVTAKSTDRAGKLVYGPKRRDSTFECVVEMRVGEEMVRVVEVVGKPISVDGGVEMTVRVRGEGEWTVKAQGGRAAARVYQTGGKGE
jgi:hypothetical protein